MRLGWSIRARLVVGVVLLAAAGLAVASVSGIVLLRSYLLDRADAQVQTLAPTDAPELRPRADLDLCVNPRDPQGIRGDFALIVLDENGGVACSLGPALEGAGPDLESEDLAAAGSAVVTVHSADGESRWRLRAERNRDSGQTVVLAVSLADADATVARLTQLSSIISVIVLILTGAAAWTIARFGLAPLARIEESAQQIAAGDLSERVPRFRRGTEVGRLSHALNGMLGQIERAFNARAESESRLRRFVSDASHELRTPISAIRGHAEMWRTGITDDLPTVMTRIESESIRMGGLVDDMLLLARLDQSRPLVHEPVDLLTLATDAVIDARARQPRRRLTLTAVTGDHPPVVMGDEARLRQVFANLLSNAIVHTPLAAAVHVLLRTTDQHVEIDVSDLGPGMTADVLDKVFERFYRADQGRSGDSGGTGLGLAIVDSLTQAHGGNVRCTSSPGEGTTFSLCFPRADRLDDGADSSAGPGPGPGLEGRPDPAR